MDDDCTTPLIEKKRYLRSKLNKYEYFMLIFGTIGLLFSLAIAIYNISVKEDPVFPIIVIICSIFTTMYLYRGILGERSYELMLYVISAITLMFYIIINFINILTKKEGKLDLLIEIRFGVSILIIPITSIIGTLLAYNYNITGKLILHLVGGLERLQESCKNLFVYQGLLQLDFQFELCMLVLCLSQTRDIGVFQYVVLSIGIPFSIIWRIVGYLSVRYEKPIWSYLFLAFGIIEPGYVIYIIYNTIYNILVSYQVPIIKPVAPVVPITFACCLLSLLIRILLVIMHIIVHRKFGIGLKEKLDRVPTNELTENESINPLITSSIHT